MSWLPGDFVHPEYVPVPATALHLRPIREADTTLDYPAVMGSRARLWEIFGPAWAWPKETMTYEQDRADLLRHEKEIAAHRSFNYALLDERETAVLGCVYIDPTVRCALRHRPPVRAALGRDRQVLRRPPEGLRRVAVERVRLGVHRAVDRHVVGRVDASKIETFGPRSGFVTASGFAAAFGVAALAGDVPAVAAPHRVRPRTFTMSTSTER